MKNPLEKPYVFVLTHADVWGAYNANWLVKGIIEAGAKPILIISGSTLGKDGKPLTKVKDLIPIRELKEQSLLAYFAIIDEFCSDPTITPEQSTFSRLARTLCADKTLHSVDSGGFKGGKKIADIFLELEEQGIVPELVLSGDTLAILPEGIVNSYPCFNIHPGPLDGIKIAGMQGTARSMLNRIFYSHNGAPLPPDTPPGWGDTNVQGTLFQLYPKLDDGPVIDTVLTPVCPGMCLFQIRTDLYYALCQSMLTYLPTLLDKQKRQDLLETAVEQKRMTARQEHEEIPPLDSEKFNHWQTSGLGMGCGSLQTQWPESNIILGPDGKPANQAGIAMEMIPNSVISPSYFRHRMSDFWAGREDEFKAVFQSIFGSRIETIDSKTEQQHRQFMRDTMTFVA